MVKYWWTNWKTTESIDCTIVTAPTQTAHIRWANVGRWSYGWINVGVGSMTLAQRWSNVIYPINISSMSAPIYLLLGQCWANVYKYNYDFTMLAQRWFRKPLRNWNVCGRPAVSLLQTCSKQLCLQRGDILVRKCLQLFASSLRTLVLSLANLQQTRRDWPWSQIDCKKKNCLYSVCNQIAIKIIQSKYLQEVCKDIASMPANQIPRFLSAMFPPVLNVWCL